MTTTFNDKLGRYVTDAIADDDHFAKIGSTGADEVVSAATLSTYAGGGGDVTKVGTPVDNQIGVWTGDGTLEGDAAFTWDGSHLVLPQNNDAATPTLDFGNNNGFFSGTTAQLNVSIAGTERLEINASDIRGLSSGGPFIDLVAATATNPVYSFVNDAATGVGRQATGNVSLIGSGAEALRAENPAALAAGETALWLYDADNATIEQVTVGVADSGGAGFKVLRIPN